MYTLIILVVGIFIGWNLPQPQWAKTLQEKVVHALHNLFRDSSKKR